MLCDECVPRVRIGSDMMLAKLQLVLDTKSLDFRKASSLQGFLMERIDTGYAELLHRQQMHPYSQAVLAEKGQVIWQISALNQTALEQIVRPMMSVDLIRLHREKHPICILEKHLTTLEDGELLQEFYGKTAEMNLTVEFLAPTAFRQHGRYVILPDVRLICQNLMMRQSVLMERIDMMDEETMEQLVSECMIVRHRIRSMIFPAERTTIPGFVGMVTFRCFGTKTMARYLRLLLRFGEFSGVGIKTGMGMGAIRIRRDEG